MRRIIFLLLLLGGALSPVACRNTEAIPYVDLQTEDSAPVAGEQLAAGKLPLRLAVAAVFSPDVTFDSYGPMLDY